LLLRKCASAYLQRRPYIAAPAGIPAWVALRQKCPGQEPKIFSKLLVHGGEGKSRWLQLPPEWPCPSPTSISGRKVGQHLVNLTDAWGRIRTAAAFNNLRIHGLWRTVESWLVRDGASLHWVGSVLDHKNQKDYRQLCRIFRLGAAQGAR